MKEAKARKIFADIFNEGYRDEEKQQAIEIICLLPSLNGIDKESMRRAICWMAGYQYGRFIGRGEEST